MTHAFDVPATHAGRSPEPRARWLRRLLCGGAVAVLTATSAAAETNEGAVLDELVVTANKREERLKDVPSAVTAVTGDTLAAIGASRLEDYVARVPGLVLNNVSFQNGSQQLTIRGITTGVGGNPTVGIYIDDSPFGSSTGSGAVDIPDLDPSDLARIEVLRGPQGTLYGAGAMGGLFKYVTAEPDPKGFKARVEVGGSTVDGGDSAYVVRGAVNVPINDQLAARLSAYDRTDPGFIDNVRTGEKNVNDAHFYGARGSLAWRPNERWKVRLSGLMQWNSSDGSAVEDHSPTTFAPLYGEYKQSRAAGTGHNKQRLSAYDLQVEGDLGFATLTSSSSYDRQVVNLNLDVSSALTGLIDAFFGVPGAGAAILTDRNLDKYTEELRLTSAETDSPISWMIGGFYTREDSFLRQQIVPFNGATGAPLPTALPTILDATIDARFEEIAAFGNVTYKFSDRFDVTLGARYSSNKQKQLESLSGVLGGGSSVTPGKSKDHSFTYLVNPRLHLTDDTMVYARIASGYRPGGPNLTVANVPAAYGPDKVTNYELGLKTTQLNGALTLDLAAFYIDWKNIQLNQRNPQGLNYFGNAGAAVSKGFEASAVWRPAQGLELAANVIRTDAELDSPLPPGDEAANKGDPLPTTPDWAAQLSADYEFPLTNDWTGVVGASYRYVGVAAGYFVGPALPRYKLPDYDVVDLRVGARNDRWSITVFAKNLGDSHGQVASYLIGNEARVSVIQPRTFGVSLSSTF
jgi:outer membrane receptor protein involved in Fe transport